MLHIFLHTVYYINFLLMLDYIYLRLSYTIAEASDCRELSKSDPYIFLLLTICTYLFRTVRSYLFLTYVGAKCNDFNGTYN